MAKNYPSEWQWNIWDNVELPQGVAVGHLGRCNWHLYTWEEAVRHLRWHKVTKVSDNETSGITQSNPSELQWDTWSEWDAVEYLKQHEATQKIAVGHLEKDKAIEVSSSVTDLTM